MRRSLRRIGFGIEEIGFLCLRAPRLALAAIALVTIAAGAAATQIHFEDNLYEIYRSDAPEFREYSAMASLFPATLDQVVIVLEGPDVTTKRGIELVRELHLDLEWVDGVLGATSVFSARERAAAGETPDPLIPAEIPEDAALKDLLSRLIDHPIAGRRLLSLEPPATLISVSLDPAFDPLIAARHVADVARQIVDEHGAGLAIDARLTGAPLLRLEILDFLRRDQIVLTAAGAIITFLVCVAFFGRWRLVLAAVVPGLVGTVWTVGGYAIAGQEINVVNAVLPALVIVLTMSDSLHLTAETRSGLAEGLTPAEAAWRAVEVVGPACAMTMLTTAVVFLTLLTSDSTAIRDFGSAGAWAVLMAFVAGNTLVPCLCVMLMRRSDGDAISTRAGRALSEVFVVATDASARLVSRRPRLLTAIGLALLVLTTAAYMSVESHYTYREFLPDGSEGDEAIDRIDALFAGADRVQVLVRRNGTAPTPAGEAAAAVREVHRAVASTDGFGNVESLVTAEDWLGRDLSVWAEGGPGDAVSGLPQHIAARLKSADGSAWLVNASLSAVDASQSVPVLDRLETALKPVRASLPGYDIYVTGVVPMTARSSLVLIDELNWNQVTDILVTMILVAVALRSMAMGVLVAIPNLLPLSIVGTALLVTGSGLQITSVVALSVAFALAVDDTVHLVHRWQIGRSTVPGTEAAINALKQVGSVVFVATMILITGMVATLASSLPVVRLFGSLCILTFIAGLAAEILLTPALLFALSQHQERKNGRS